MFSLHLTILLIISPSFISTSELDYDGWLQIKLLHTFDDCPDPIFIERGNISVSSIRLGAANIHQLSLQDRDLSQLKKLALNAGKYQLKSIVRTSSGSETSFLSSVPACHLLNTNFQDSIYVWLDSGAEPVAVNLMISGSCTLSEPSSRTWTTNVQVKYPDSGPVPDTATYIHKLEREREARERGDTKDNRSFLARYWMYIVPALILFVLMSAQNPEGGPGSSAGISQR